MMHRALRLFLVLFPALLSIGLTGCEDSDGIAVLIEAYADGEIQELWDNAQRKDSATENARISLWKDLNKSLPGTKVVKAEYEWYHWIFSPVVGLVYHDVFIERVTWVWVDLGYKSLKVKVDRSLPVLYESDGRFHVFYFHFIVTIPPNNGGWVGIDLDLRPAFPDHHVGLSNIEGDILGFATVTISDDRESKIGMDLEVYGHSLTMDSNVSGWLWTVDITNKVKKAVNKALFGRVIRLAYSPERAFGLPGEE